jgi:hypothetical protein
VISSLDKAIFHPSLAYYYYWLSGTPLNLLVIALKYAAEQAYSTAGVVMPNIKLAFGRLSADPATIVVGL